MKTTSPAELQPESQEVQSLTLGEYGYSMINEQYHRVIKYEKPVLADDDLENLHHMRVGTRRLRTALQVFGMALKVPKAGSIRRITELARVLGQLRDLDVQLANLKDVYRPQLDKKEQKLLDGAIKALKKQRSEAFAAVEDTLARSRYQDLKQAYETWLEKPQYTAIAQLPLLMVLPDLLNPLLSELLLHPGWLIPADHSSQEESKTLHELRKVCKHVRYQTEFFVCFYGDPFQKWIKAIKVLQDQLGAFQDSQVLIDLLNTHLPASQEMKGLQAIIQRNRTDILSTWDETRQQYLDSDFRLRLHHILLQPLQNSETLSSPEEQSPQRDPQPLALQQ
ncbi:CHAD domain-containing protein [Leptodesmis sp.]|uniref:CHAD domain-containing protein n=1 Tax=Leptodesmis sp. TaxID=3100501 RepID=UPI0040535064